MNLSKQNQKAICQEMLCLLHNSGLDHWPPPLAPKRRPFWVPALSLEIPALDPENGCPSALKFLQLYLCARDCMKFTSHFFFVSVIEMKCCKLLILTFPPCVTNFT